jgi:triosephosphate isomerase
VARKKFIAGNWKMFTTAKEARSLAEGVRQGLEGFTAADAAVCPPFTNLAAVAEVLAGSPVALGAQNVHWEKSGAFTGEIAADMLAVVGCRYVIVGHSERRQFFGETDETVNRRMKAVLAGSQLELIFCLGEILAERKEGKTEAVVKRQFEGAFVGITAADLPRITMAYEPVWAIGTGVNATPQQAQDVHAYLRGLISTRFGAAAAAAFRIQYGGSVKPENAAELLACPDVDGALVGGASLKADSFVKIVKASGG